MAAEVVEVPDVALVLGNDVMPEYVEKKSIMIYNHGQIITNVYSFCGHHLHDSN